MFNKKNCLILSLIFISFTLSINCDLNKLKSSNIENKPTIVSFNPISGPVGTTVTIQGKNFSAMKSSDNLKFYDIVKFNNVEAVIKSSTTTEIVTTVPNGATTGKIEVTVYGLSDTSDIDFTVTNGGGNVINSPTITSFSPTSGLVGTTVSIIGTNFSTTLSENNVKFNNIVAVVTSATATELVVTVPNNATTGKITVTVAGVTATSTNDFTVTSVNTNPTITSFSPTSGMVGTTVTIIGTNFGSLIYNNVVKFNNITAIITSASTTQLIVTVPNLSTTGKITVSVGGKTATSIDDFIVIPDNSTNNNPTITSFSPSSGPIGTTVNIIGTNFSNVISNNTVNFNNIVAVVTSATTTQLVVSVPKGATTGKITVTVGGKTATSATDFVVNSTCPTSITIDGRIYKTVEIGNQCWMAENLATTKHNVGFSEVVYGMECLNFGRFYTILAAKSVDTLVDGWHLPTDEDWDKLTTYLGGSTVAGGKLKTTGSSGFNAQLAGYRSLYVFTSLGKYGYFLSSSNTNDPTYQISLYYINNLDDSFSKDVGFNYSFSVRLIKD